MIVLLLFIEVFIYLHQY